MRFALIAAVLCLCLLPRRKSPSPRWTRHIWKPIVRHLLAVIPEVQVKIDDPKPSPVPDLLQVDVHFTYKGRSQDETFFVTKDGKHIIRGVDLRRRAESVPRRSGQVEDRCRAQLWRRRARRSSMVVFSDFECPELQRRSQDLARKRSEPSFPRRSRVYFKDFPLEAIHPWAKAAAIAGRCVFRQSPAAFWKYHDWIYEHQAEITPENLKDKVIDLAKTAPRSMALQLGRCIDTKATEAEVDASLAEGHALQRGRNAHHVYERPPAGRQLSLAESRTDHQWRVELSEDRIAAPKLPSRRKCCEVKIPSPLNK